MRQMEMRFIYMYKRRRGLDNGTSASTELIGNASRFQLNGFIKTRGSFAKLECFAPPAVSKSTMSVE